MKIVVIGAGFSGLSAALELSESNHEVIVLDALDQPGGLAAGFQIPGGQRLERFYHHWFTSDKYIMGVVNRLNLKKNLKFNQSRTGLYYNKNFYKLSSPIDLLRFKALGFFSRIRLGMLVFVARSVRNWRELEKTTARDWLVKIAGAEAYRVVWEPLLKGKFGPYAERVSAVWFWNKLCLRGGSRGKDGKEQLVYFEGGFMSLADKMAEKIQANGGIIHYSADVQEIVHSDGVIKGVKTKDHFYECDLVIATPALPIIASLLKEQEILSEDPVKLDSIDYLANLCLILELDRSLSNYYWLNVNDPSFPFVGMIEHTNFENKNNYGGKHIVYLSKYLPRTSELYSMTKDEFFEYALQYIQVMFPDFDPACVIDKHLWKADYAQPVVDCEYSKKIPKVRSSIKGLYICTMAQIYPEDRGTNYAIRSGQEVAQIVNQDYS